MFDHNLFLSNFFSSFRSSTNFQDILNRSFAEASVRKNPTSKEARANFAKVKITKDHCKIGKDGKNEEPSWTICISEIPINQQGIVLTCGHIFSSRLHYRNTGYSISYKIFLQLILKEFKLGYNYFIIQFILNFNNLSILNLEW